MKQVYKVIVEDYSGLGGPMGSERTSVIETFLVYDLTKIKPYLVKHYKHNEYLLKHFPAKPKLIGYDMMSIGVTIQKQKKQKVVD